MADINLSAEQVAALILSIGDKSKLKTAEKKTLVDAINNLIDSNLAPTSVLYTPMELSNESKEQARENIGAGVEEYRIPLSYDEESGEWSTIITPQNLYSAYSKKKQISAYVNLSPISTIKDERNFRAETISATRGLASGTFVSVDTDKITKLIFHTSEDHRSFVITEQTAEIAPLIDPEIYYLENPAVSDFVSYCKNNPYDDDDYTYSYVDGAKKTDFNVQHYSMEEPLPVVIKWGNKTHAIKTNVIVNTDSHLEGAAGYKRFDASGLNQYCIYNLLPNKKYYYKVQCLKDDGLSEVIKSGSFVTADQQVRMLKAEGLYNVRDLGGHYIASQNKQVKYGLLFRGSTGNESASASGLPMNTMLSGSGRLEMLDNVGIKAELDFRGDGVSIFGGNIAYIHRAFNSYDNALPKPDDTEAVKDVKRQCFKELFEQVVNWISAAKPKPVYMHCQGGFDRTGTFVTILLGLLGVSESDLAMEYELSSFSELGRRTRLRKNANGYRYASLIEAIKTYSGDTITEKCEAFALDCGINSDTIQTFRATMLEDKPEPPTPPTPETNLFDLNRNTVITGDDTTLIADRLNSDNIINCYPAAFNSQTNPIVKNPLGILTYSISNNALTVNNVTAGYEIAFPVPIEAGKYKVTFAADTTTAISRHHFMMFNTLTIQRSAPNTSFYSGDVFDNSQGEYNWILLGFGAKGGNSTTYSDIKLVKVEE